jgi:hypothetical protein
LHGKKNIGNKKMFQQEENGSRGAALSRGGGSQAGIPMQRDKKCSIMDACASRSDK